MVAVCLPRVVGGMVAHGWNINGWALRWFAVIVLVRLPGGGVGTDGRGLVRGGDTLLGCEAARGLFWGGSSCGGEGGLGGVGVWLVLPCWGGIAVVVCWWVWGGCFLRTT